MAKVVALVGSKGGVGKTTTAHLLGHAAGSLARLVPTVVLTTDGAERPRQDAEARRYLIADGRTPRQLADELDRWLAVERMLVIVDGAAGRRDLDELVAEVADVVVLPYGPSEQDAERAADELGALPGAWALPTRWPTHPGTRRNAEGWLDMVPAARRLAPFPAIPRLAGILSPTGYPAMRGVAGPARRLLLEILDKGGIEIESVTEAAG